MIDSFSFFYFYDMRSSTPPAIPCSQSLSVLSFYSSILFFFIPFPRSFNQRCVLHTCQKFLLITGESRRTLLCSSLCSYPTEFVLAALSTSDSSKTERATSDSSKTDKGWFSLLSFKPRAFGLKKHILGPKKGRRGSLCHGTAEERRCRGSHRVTAEEAERIRMRLLMRVRIFLV